MSDARPRLLVFIVAYYAESTLTSVLERIPAQVRDDYDCEILVVDDASEDRTYALGREYQRAHPEIRMTVLRNELNQGYGGNQKIGYTFAVERGFDIVVLLHGDGQYAPEEMPRLLTPLRDRWADAVFGSRMMTAFGALRGGVVVGGGPAARSAREPHLVHRGAPEAHLRPNPGRDARRHGDPDLRRPGVDANVAAVDGRRQRDPGVARPGLHGERRDV